MESKWSTVEQTRKVLAWSQYWRNMPALTPRWALPCLPKDGHIFQPQTFSMPCTLRHCVTVRSVLPYHRLWHCISRHYRSVTQKASESARDHHLSTSVPLRWRYFPNHMPRNCSVVRKTTASNVTFLRPNALSS